MSVPKLLIAGGGTGGHIFPGIAIAEEWTKRGGDVVFVGTPRGQEGKLIPKYGFELRFLNVGRLKGGGVLQKLKTIAGLPFALFKAISIIRKEKPKVVLGIGGYASGPTAIAARLLCKFTAITDQNVQPGMTNRVLGKVVRRIYISFLKSKIFFPENKVEYVGNPVRSHIVYSEYSVFKETFHIFIFGGSQGAVTMNSQFMEAIDRLKEWWPRLRITHQAGASDLENIKKFYEQRGIQAEVNSFFENMNELYAMAHLVVCRAGAGTLTELALSGRPSILVPYPFAADDHQTKNAEVFVEAQAAIMIEQKTGSVDVWVQHLQKLFDTPELLQTMAKKAKELAKPRAAQDIVDDLLRRVAA